jgi:hypothetical protein
MDVESEVTSKINRVSKKGRHGDARMAASKHYIIGESCWYTSPINIVTMARIFERQVMLVEASVTFIYLYAITFVIQLFS